MPSTTESPPSAGSGASGRHPSSGSAAAEGCVTVQALREEFSCCFEFVSDETESEKPGSHSVFGVFVLLGLGACRPHRFGHLGKGETKLNVAFQLSGVKSVLPAVRRGIELEESELNRALGEGGMEVQHMVAAVVVVLASAVVCVLAAVPDIRKPCQGGWLFAVDLVKEVWVDRPAVAVHSAAVKGKCIGEEAFVACHDVGEVSEGLRRMSFGSNVDVNSAAVASLLAPSLRSRLTSSCRVSISA